MDRGIKTFTKKWVGIILAVSLFDLQLSYILAFFDKVEIAESLSITIVTEIIGVFIVYSAKSFFEKKESAKNKAEKVEEKVEEEDKDI